MRGGEVGVLPTPWSGRPPHAPSDQAPVLGPPSYANEKKRKRNSKNFETCQWRNRSDNIKIILTPSPHLHSGSGCHGEKKICGKMFPELSSTKCRLRSIRRKRRSWLRSRRIARRIRFLLGGAIDLLLLWLPRRRQGVRPPR